MRLFHSFSFEWIALLIVTTVFSGCASIGGSNGAQTGRIKILSEPAGAMVYANGIELGRTPLQIIPGDHFRSGFAGFSYRYLGSLSIRQAGCETWSTEVNDNILSKDVQVRLKCDPGFRPVSPAAPSAGGPSRSMSNLSSGDQAIERLERIEILYKKGLISDEEYTQLRARIIDRL